jgi:hypothetical protein
MSSTTEGRKPWGRYAMERALAPHVDETWAESFIVELRLIGVPGDRIGAALSEVESHCNESGQNAQQAFGDPIDYANSLQLPMDDQPSARAMLYSVAPILVQALGMTALDWGFAAWLRSQQLEITTGHLVNASLGLLLMVAVVIFADRVFRAAVHHPRLSAVILGLTLVATAATGVAALKLLDEVIWSGSAGWGLAVGAATLAGGVAWAVVRLAAHGSEEDPITSPFQNADTSSSNKATGPLTRLSETSWLATFPYVALIPLGTLFLFAMTLLIHVTSTR